MRFIPRQEVSEKIVDAQHPEVTAWGCECRKCGHVFRVYPKLHQNAWRGVRAAG